MTALHRHQIAAGRAAWLGQPWPADRQLPALADLDRAVAAVRALVARHESGTPT